MHAELTEIEITQCRLVL